jgi:ABC-2 type transport system ATP-binding protein
VRPLLDIRNLTKTYRNGVRANDDVTLAVESGEVYGLLGPNGAGKTTLVSQVLGVVLPDAGTVRIDGADVVRRPDVARRMCSYQPQAAAPVDGLSPREAVEIVGRIRGGDAKSVRRRTGELLEALDLTAVADRAAPMSGGMARLTGFCMAAVVPGRVVVLDEPTNDVDPLRRRALWTQIRRLADNGAAVLLVTHNVLEAERCVDRLAIVAGGRVLAQGPPARLKAALEAPLRLECTVEPGVPAPRPPAEVAVTSTVGRRMIAHVQTEDLASAVAWAQRAQHEGAVTEFAVSPASLEDVYATWVAGEEQPA